MVGSPILPSRTITTIMDLKDTYNNIAEAWAKNRPVEWMQQTIDKFISYLKVGDLVLDAGCGSGDKSEYLIEKGMRVIGIDFSEKMIEIAKRTVSAGEFSVMDVREMGKIDKQFDGIFARAVLLHFKKVEVLDILKLMKDKLNNGGYLFVAVKERRENENEEELVKEDDYGQEIERFFSYFSMGEMEDYFDKLGMEICFKTVTVVKTGTRRWIQIIARKNSR